MARCHHAGGSTARSFRGGEVPAVDSRPERERPPRPAPAELGDAVLIATIPGANFADCRALAAEAGRRRLAAAVAALEALCRRFRGFGCDSAVLEQVAALAALATIGGRDAAAAAARLIVDDIVQDPGLARAVRAAASLGARLPANSAAVLLRHREAAVRADACRCARPEPAVIGLLIDLLDDLNDAVASAAACALGHMGREEARPLLLRLLRWNPTAAVVAATVGIADADSIVQLGRVARTRPDLAEAAREALGEIDDPRASALLAAIPDAE